MWKRTLVTWKPASPSCRTWPARQRWQHVAPPAHEYNPACVQDPKPEGEIRSALRLGQERLDWYTRDAMDALKIVKKPATRKKKTEAFGS